VFNITLLLAIEANTQLEVGIGRKVLFLYKKAKNSGAIYFTFIREFLPDSS
jgi:hypothetical protein